MTVDAGELSFLDMLVKLRKMTISFVMSVHLHEASRLPRDHEILSVFFKNLLRNSSLVKIC
jgi:hypothetical protein